MAAPAGRGTSAVSARALPQAEAMASPLPAPTSFRAVLALFDERREAILRTHLYAHTHLVAFEPGRVQLRLEAGAPRDLVNRVAQKLSEWTGQTWLVGVTSAGGEPTLKEQDEAQAHSIRGEAARHPLVRAVLDAFPGARIEAVRDIETPAPDDAPPVEPDEQTEENGDWSA
jgi:DNA polymerase-3 subunit gamma/tau